MNESTASDVLNGLVDRRRPVAGPAGALRASKIAPGDFVATLAMTSHFLTSKLVQDPVAAASKTSFKNHPFFTIAVNR